MRRWRCYYRALLLGLLLLTRLVRAGSQQKNDDEDVLMGDAATGDGDEPHPDPNQEHYEGMIYVGRLDASGRRMSADHDYTVRYIFGTSFDESHRDIAEEDLRHDRYGPSARHDVPDRGDGRVKKTREEVLKERRHKNVTGRGPVPYGHVDTHPLDGGVVPVKAVSVEPFFLDEVPVTNKEFAKFVKSTFYETEAEKYGWSYVLASFLSQREGRVDDDEEWEVDPEAEHWVAVKGAYWRQPEGPASSYKYREHHPVVHVSHRDAAEYCHWKDKRLPGEWEWEAAARAERWTSHNRTLFIWGDDPSLAPKHANLWGTQEFPWHNDAADGWRGTSPVRTYPPNPAGFYDLTGNVWEWMRGGKLKARIVRGASYVDSTDGSFNHAATVGARAVLHGTTTTGNVGFRCARSVKKRVEHHWTWHDEEEHGMLAIEDQYGRRDMIPQREWEDQFRPDDDDDVDEDELPTADGEPVKKRKKKKVVYKRERLQTEL
jgi:formylglycine-generating enzyme required for sulfatase activity